MLQLTGIRAALLVLLVAASSRPALAEKFDAGKAIRAAVGLIEQEHLRQWPLDDKLSRRWLASLVERLDPDKLLFLQADRDEFEKYADRLDDFAKAENPEFSNLLRKRYQERWTEAAKLAEQQLVAKHDFTIEEEVPPRYEKAAVDAQVLAERWRKRIKLELLIEKIHGRILTEVKSQLASRYERLRQLAVKLDDEQWTAQYIRALTVCFDPESSYFSEEEGGYYDDYRIRHFSFDVKIQYREGLRFVYALPHHPWELEQRLVGYQLLAVRRIDGPMYDVVGMDLNEYWKLAHRIDGPFAEDKAIILELLNLVTLERVSLKCSRYELRRLG